MSERVTGPFCQAARSLTDPFPVGRRVGSTPVSRGRSGWVRQQCGIVFQV